MCTETPKIKVCLVLALPLDRKYPGQIFQRYRICNLRRFYRLRVVSNFGDRLWGGRNFEETRREGSVASSRNFARARVCISPAPQSPLPKLETTRSLKILQSPTKNKISIKLKIYDWGYNFSKPAPCRRPKCNNWP